MNRVLSRALLVLILAGIVQCSTYSPYQPLIFGVSSQTIHGVSNGGIIGPGKVMKQGESCSYNVLWVFKALFSVPGGSIADASVAGGISKIAVVDRSSFNILVGAFSKECVVVWGE